MTPTRSWYSADAAADHYGLPTRLSDEERRAGRSHEDHQDA
ncbi:hypothetical protein RKD30_006510 [Streptomyces pristinaespiralis]